MAGVLFVLGTAPSLAQNADVAANTSATGENTLKLGDAALAAGKHSAATTAYTKAMSSEGLSQEDFARALYRRGVAYRQSDKPAQAIADLTKALWLKKLTPLDRADALRHRALAYEAVGQKGRAVADQKAIQSGKSAAKGTAADAAEVASTKNVPSGSWKTAVTDKTAKTTSDNSGQASNRRGGGLAGFFRNLRTRTSTPSSITTGADSKPSEPARKAAAKTPKTPARSESKSNVVETGEAPGEESSDTTAALAGWETNVAEPSRRGLFGFASRVGRSSFFSSASASDDDAPTNLPKKNSNRTRAEASRAAGPTRSDTSGSAEKTPTKSVATLATGTGPAAESLLFTGYRIQLAAVSSQSGAKESWRRLAAKYTELLSGWDPEFRDIGNSGKFGVQIGPFADKDEPQNLCKTFKKNGLDCIIVAR